MEGKIATVELSQPTKLQLDMGANVSFIVTWADGSFGAIPIDPVNRHYWEIREWYFKQPKKPFDFEFEPLTKVES